MKCILKNGLARFVTKHRLSTRLLFMLVIGTAFHSVASGQERPIQFAVDYAQFRLQRDFVYLEIYYSIPRKNLTYHQAQAGLQAQALIQTYVQQGDQTILVDSLLIQDEIQSRSEIASTQKFVEISAIQIKAADYLLRAILTDLNTSKSIQWSDSLKIRLFPTDSLVFSDIELATSIQPQSLAGDRYVKNGLRVTPNPSTIYGTGLTHIYFYAEAYNLAVSDAAANSTYHLEYAIFDGRENLVQRLAGTPKTKPGTSTVVHGSLDISDLTSGIYRLQLKIIDDYNQHRAIAEKTFFIYKAEDLLKAKLATADATPVSSENEFMLMDEVALNDYFQMLRYIASEEEKSLFKKLDVNGKRNLLVSFWQQRDPDPQTEVNEAKKTYLELLEFANREYAIRNNPGWKSDRGRVLLSYGRPDFVERVAATADARAYQVWYYYQLEGGVEFIFVERRADSDYQLVHSTKRNEIHDYEWKTHYVLQ